MSDNCPKCKVIEAAARGNAVWAVPFFGDHFGEAERATYIASLQVVGEGLSLFIENEELRTFLEGVLQAELQSAPHIIVGKPH